LPGFALPDKRLLASVTEPLESHLSHLAFR
jgi:hypothetical protein